MRVLMISKACIVGTYQRKLEELARLGVELTVIVPPEWRDPSGTIRLERVHTQGYRLLVEPMQFNGNFHLHRWPALAQRMAEIQPEIVHIDEEPYNLATWQALRLARKHGAKALFFSWQNLVRRYPPPFAWIERWVLDTIDYALMGTESAADVWRAKGYRGRLAVIPQFGIDPDFFTPPASINQSKTVRIGYVGRLVPEKGVDVLLRALAGLPGDWCAEVVGQGPERAALESLTTTLGLSARVQFTGQVRSTALPDVYRQLDILVIPSLSRPNWKEQFGRVILEANACGVPVIGSDSGAIPGLIGHGGLIFPEGDSDALRAHLTRLIDNPVERIALGTAGRAQVLAAFTHAQVAAHTAAVYRAMIAKDA
jgi:glycosyltransferase involved in cell wall biosynthesis